MTGGILTISALLSSIQVEEIHVTALKTAARFAVFIHWLDLGCIQ